MSFQKPHNGHGMPMRDLGGIVIRDGETWSARDKQLGTTGRRMGDPEYKEYVLYGGMHHARSLAHDHLTLLSVKERAAFDCALMGAKQNKDGRCILLAHHVPPQIQNMPGKKITQVTINLDYAGIAGEPRWNMRFEDGELIGGRVPMEQPVSRQTRVHHHELPAQHIFHGSKW
jgi:hypothetical protein